MNPPSSPRGWCSSKAPPSLEEAAPGPLRGNTGGTLTRKETRFLQPEVTSWKEALPELSVRKICVFSFPWFLTESRTCLWGSPEPSALCSRICAGREGEMPRFVGAAAVAEQGWGWAGAGLGAAGDR